MPDPTVKGERYGTRPSVVEPLLQKFAIPYTKNIWIVSARRSGATYLQQRHLVFVEFPTVEDFQNRRLNLAWLRPEIRGRAYGIFVDLPKEQIYLKYATVQNIARFSHAAFRSWVRREMATKFDVITATIPSRKATPFGQFLRRDMARGFAVTDIDFLIWSQRIPVFLEEKTFVREGHGYVGVGQCISYKNFRKYFAAYGSRIFVVCSGHPQSRFYVTTLEHISCDNRTLVPGWGEMVPVPLGRALQEVEFGAWLITGCKEE